MDKGYRGMGFFQELFPLAQGMKGVGGEMYGGVLGRMAISARGIIPSIKQGSEFCGFIPKSLRLSKFGWISDTIGYRDITGFMDESWKNSVSCLLSYLIMPSILKLCSYKYLGNAEAFLTFHFIKLK